MQVWWPSPSRVYHNYGGLTSELTVHTVVCMCMFLYFFGSVTVWLREWFCVCPCCMGVCVCVCVTIVHLAPAVWDIWKLFGRNYRVRQYYCYHSCQHLSVCFRARHCSHCGRPYIVTDVYFFVDCSGLAALTFPLELKSIPFARSLRVTHALHIYVSTMHISPHTFSLCIHRCAP
jgi:hypothetical protein